MLRIGDSEIDHGGMSGKTRRSTLIIVISKWAARVLDGSAVYYQQGSIDGLFAQIQDKLLQGHGLIINTYDEVA
jgi:hypothetical protein